MLLARGRYSASTTTLASTLLVECRGSLFASLRQGVPTGFDNDIPRGHTLFPRREEEPNECHDLLICEGNWQGAEAHLALLQELIEEELASGFIEEMPNLEAAFQRWGTKRGSLWEE